MKEEIETEKDFLQIKAIRTSSNAFVMKLEEGDIIIALDGLIVNKSYDDLTKELNEIEDKKIITKGMGWDKFSDTAKKSSIRSYAIGGLSNDDFETASKHYACGIAGISMFNQSS